MLERGWTTVGRPTNPAVGTFGFNRSLVAFEWWNGAAWVAFGGAGVPDVATIAASVREFMPDPDPVWGGGAGVGLSNVNGPVGYLLPAGLDRAVYVPIVLPRNLDGTRNYVLHVKIDDAGGGTGLAFYALEVAIEDVVCGGPQVSGVRGPVPGMAPQAPVDLLNTTQCLTFTSAGPYPGGSGIAFVSVRRRGTTDTAPGNLRVLGISLELPTTA